MATKNESKTAEQLNETGRRKNDRRSNSEAPAKSENRKTQRRRLIDPTTCERDYSNAEIEFMQAMDDYKRRSGRMFPTCSEILEVISELGYRKIESDQWDLSAPADSSKDDYETTMDQIDAELEEEFDIDLQRCGHLL